LEIGKSTFACAKPEELTRFLLLNKDSTYPAAWPGKEIPPWSPRIALHPFSRLNPSPNITKHAGYLADCKTNIPATNHRLEDGGNAIKTKMQTNDANILKYLAR